MVLTPFLDPLQGWRGWLHAARAPRPVLAARPHVTRWFAVQLADGQTEEVPPVSGRLVLHCRQGALWITHDGEARDVVVAEGESHAVDSPRRLRVHAMAPASVEIQLDAAG